MSRESHPYPPDQEGDDPVCVAYCCDTRQPLCMTDPGGHEAVPASQTGAWFTACSQRTVLPTMARVTVPSSSRPRPAARAGANAGPPAAESQQSRRQIHDVTITIDDGQPGPVVPGDFAGLSFERQALNPGHAGVTGRLFMSANESLVTLFRNLGVRSQIGRASCRERV